ncbi:MAG TPA: glycine oxidase ThiO [Vicinamibacterales bacterium]
MAPPSEIVVVGAGIIGCAVAYELARRGATVQIVDDRPAGSGATQAAAGVLAPYVEARHGGPLLELTVRGLDLFDDFVAGVTASGGAAVSYHRTGTLDAALDEASLAVYAETAATLGAKGVGARLLDASAARAAEPHLSAAAVGGLLIPCHGYVAATELTRALAAAARRHGARFVEHGRVRRIAASGSELCIEAERGSLRAQTAVVAAGSWASQIEIAGAGVRVPVKPIRGQLLQLAWRGPSLRRVVWGERCYVVPWPDGTVLVGATVEDAGFDERTTVAGVTDLLEAACELLPHAWTASFAAARVGLRPGTPDELPIIGRSTVLPGVFYATGHYRNGVLLSGLTARLVADALLERVDDPLLALTRPDRFGAV